MHIASTYVNKEAVHYSNENLPLLGVLFVDSISGRGGAERASVCWRYSSGWKLHFSALWIKMDNATCSTKRNTVSQQSIARYLCYGWPYNLIDQH